MDSADMSTAIGLVIEASNPDRGESSETSNGSLTQEDIERLIREKFQVSTSNFNPVTQASLIAAFTVLIAFGTAGNSLVCYVVLANRHMRTPRNVLITNLAASDLVLCLFTQPFNLMKVSMPTWRLGTAVCKLLPMASGTNVFVSTISITAIALDRFHLIVHPTETDLLLMKSGASIALVFIWILSMLMATPMLVFSSTKSVEPVPGVKLYDVCVENPDHHYAKVAYSVASMIVQYLVPIAILSVAHAQICKKLRYRMATSRPTVNATTTTSTATAAVAPLAARETPLHTTAALSVLSPFQARKLQMEKIRKRKTNLLLVMIAVVFASGWMPLNVINVIADFDLTWILSFDKSGLSFAICHLLVLSSACANPVLYGWLNDNFRQEFLRVLCRRCQRTKAQSGVGGSERGRTRHCCLPCCWRSPERATPKETLGLGKTSSPRTVVSSMNHSVETAVHLKDLSVKVEAMTCYRSTDL